MSKDDSLKWYCQRAGSFDQWWQSVQASLETNNVKCDVTSSEFGKKFVVY